MEYGRGYIVENNIYPSITTVLGIEKGDAIDKWRSRVGEEEANRISVRASKKGTALHEMCELYINNSLENYDNYSYLEIEGFKSILHILNEKIDNVLAQEIPLFTHKYKTAGRVDLVAEFDNVLSIIDFKGSIRPKEESWIETYFIQETGYATMLYEMTGLRIDQIVTIIAVEDEEPQVFVRNPKDYFHRFVEVRNKFKKIYGV